MAKIKHNNKKECNSSSVEFGASTFAGEATKNYANATAAAFEGMDTLKNVASRLTNVAPGQSQGNLFEYIESTKFNMNAAIKSSNLHAIVTAADGRPHAAADIEIKLGDTIVREVQAKSYRSAPESLFAQSEPKYEGMQRLSPSEQYDRMLELAHKRIETGTLKADDYRDTLGNLTPGLKHGDVMSPGTTRDEALHAATNTDTYARDFKIHASADETFHVAEHAFVAGGAICGVISIAKNTIKAQSGEIDYSTAAENVFKESGKGIFRSVATAALSTSIKDVALDHGLGTLAQSNVATAVAVTAINTSKSIIKYAKGEISLEKMTIEMGQRGASSTAGLYFGIIGGAVGGPVGALVGSMAGYTIANISYQTVVDIFNSSKLSVEGYNRLRPLYLDAIQQLDKNRIEFEQNAQKYFDYTNKQLDDSFSMIEKAITVGDLDSMSVGLVNIASIFGKDLQIKTFGDFEKFMLQEDAILKL